MPAYYPHVWDDTYDLPVCLCMSVWQCPSLAHVDEECGAVVDNIIPRRQQQWIQAGGERADTAGEGRESVADARPMYLPPALEHSLMSV